MDDRDTQQFVTDLTRIQRRLSAYILSLLGNARGVEDVLQETNVVLWAKRGEFTPGTNFVGWAFRVAHFQVLAYRKTQGRDRHKFDDGLVESLAQVAEESTGDLDRQRRLLDECVEQLTDRQRDLLRQRYEQGHDVGAIATQAERQVASMYKALHRLRARLIECVDGKLAAGVDA
ncbi:MAG: sigma-70 family RNA polymerase sigma factor [Phycisphaera sp.]|nr:sigma-70 family RNA polymerase sigma factor [Phycisphaera sp.]